MKRYILTGAPGSGKTSVIHEIRKNGYSVIEEAATDVIGQEQSLGNIEPWKHLDFIDKIVDLQKYRQVAADQFESGLQFYDRSPICTYALAEYLKFKPSDYLMDEIKRIQDKGIYEKTVFFIDNLGFIENTDARKISFEDSLRFEKIHKDAYARFGYESVHIPLGSIFERIATILKLIRSFE